MVSLGPIRGLKIPEYTLFSAGRIEKTQGLYPCEEHYYLDATKILLYEPGSSLKIG